MIVFSKIVPIYTFLDRFLLLAWWFFISMFLMDALVNLSIILWQWTAGWETFDLYKIVHRFLFAEAYALHICPHTVEGIKNCF